MSILLFCLLIITLFLSAFTFSLIVLHIVFSNRPLPVRNICLYGIYFTTILAVSSWGLVQLSVSSEVGTLSIIGISLLSSLYLTANLLPHSTRYKSILKGVGVWMIFLALVLLLLFVRHNFIGYFLVSGNSMHPAIQSGEIVFVNKSAQAERGDVLVFGLPSDPQKIQVQRVVATPGDSVSTEDKHFLLINGEFQNISVNSPDTLYFDDQLSEGEYYVIGDKQDTSSDSRAYGAIPKKFILGVVIGY